MKNVQMQGVEGRSRSQVEELTRFESGIFVWRTQ